MSLINLYSDLLAVNPVLCWGVRIESQGLAKFAPCAAGAVLLVAKGADTAHPRANQTVALDRIRLILRKHRRLWLLDD